MRREALTDGGWVDLREPGEVTVRGRRGIMAIASSIGDISEQLQKVDKNKPLTMQGFSEQQIDAILRMQEAVVVAAVAGWSRDEPAPTLATIGDLPGDLFDELTRLTAATGARIALDTSPGPDGAPDPKDRSGSSAPSAGPSKGEPEPSPTSTLPNGGEASATGG